MGLYLGLGIEENLIILFLGTYLNLRPVLRVLTETPASFCRYMTNTIFLH